MQGSLVCFLADLRTAGAAYVEAYVRDFPGHETARVLLRSHGFESRAVQPTLLYRVAEHPGRKAIRPAGVRLIDDDDVEQCVRFGFC